MGIHARTDRATSRIRREGHRIGNLEPDESAWGGRLGSVQHTHGPAVVDRPPQARGSDDGHGGLWGLYIKDTEGYRHLGLVLV